MFEHSQIVLETGSDLPIDAVGWGVLALSLVVTGVWLAYVYR
ncbi:hypothetical protein C479_03331 [Halovivax asiaticus JCM 14624]|uniref:Uncharacterized protein n=1 Tax=Halovivax asiaticus JCM 14624 TaxID=1227490 RepID=M0BSC2_9EURY|nr:hypothetical protein [Halovivax asiaticus]ELZ13845.1 hypothetical protein C479_03331 [Halovivax asiaticus JCM 14624]